MSLTPEQAAQFRKYTEIHDELKGKKVTDKEILTELFKKREIPFVEGGKAAQNTRSITLEVGFPRNEKVHGYGGFVSEFEFNESGELLRVGIWE